MQNASDETQAERLKAMRERSQGYVRRIVKAKSIRTRFRHLLMSVFGEIGQLETTIAAQAADITNLTNLIALLSADYEARLDELTEKNFEAAKALILEIDMTDEDKAVYQVEVVERKDTPGEWAVEAIDIIGDGDIFVTIFTGSDAESRASEYAAFKYGG